MPKTNLSNSQLGLSLPRWSQKILLSLLGVLLIGAVTYFQWEIVNTQDAVETNRSSLTSTDQSVIRLEVQYENIERSLQRIENTLGSMRVGGINTL